MRWFKAWMARLGGMFGKTKREQDLAAEMESHLAMHVEENVRTGMTEAEAKQNALMKLGGIEQTKEIYRDRHGLPWLEVLLQDLRFAARMLRKNPGFTAVAVLTLALGIGANTALFSIVNATILRPLPYRDSGRLVTASTKTAMFPGMNLYFSWVAFEAARAQSKTLEQSAVCWRQDKTLTGRNEPALLSVARVSDGFFEEMGTRAEVGRLLSDEDQKPGHEQVIVLSNNLWRSRFGGDGKIVGQSVTLDHESYIVAGVAERGFSFPDRTEAWVPMALAGDTRQNPTFFTFEFVGKLRRRERIEQLNAELSTIAAQIVKQHPKMEKSYTLTAQSLFESQVEDSREVYLVLLGAATFVLLIACANLASLLLARGWARQREMAVRAALGASRWRLLRQGLVESCLLALLGGAAGAALAAGGVNAFRAIAPQDTLRLAEIAPDGTLLWFALGSSLVAGVIFGLAPARRASRMAPNEALKESAGGKASGGLRQSKLGGALVSVEIALAFVLLMGSALMMRTMKQLLHQDPGFRTDHLISFDLPGPLEFDFKRAQEKLAKQTARIKELLETVRNTPGVSKVAVVNYGVLNGIYAMSADLRVEGALPGAKDGESPATTKYISPEFFTTLGIPLVRGRAFTERDVKGALETVIVNEAMAKKYWGTLDVLGKRISAAKDEKGQPIWNEVVGVSADTRDLNISTAPAPEYFLSIYQGGSGALGMIVRTEGQPDALAGTISREIWEKFPEQPVTHLMTMERTIEESVGDKRMHTTLLSVFAGTGLALALLGVYGVVGYSVARRTQEIGIRMALGARPAEVLRLVIRQALFPVAIGIAVGIAASLGMQRAIASELYGVKATDPATFFAAIILVLLVAAAACFVPARRASHVDPLVALRYE